LRKTFKLLTTPFPLLCKEGIKVLNVFCQRKKRDSRVFLILEVPFYYLDTNIGVTRLEPDAKNYDCRYKQWSGQDYGYFRHHVRSGEERD
jgi:hypothetical protein